MNYRPKLNVKDTVYLDRKFSSFSSSFFKPIVATSLLFLLPSLGMGDDKTYQVEGNGPSISVTTSEETQSTYLSWSNTCSSANGCSTGPTVNWDSSSDTWSGTFGDSSTSKTIASLTFRFDNTVSATKDTSFVMTTTATSAIGIYGSTTKASAITANFGNKSLGTSSSKIDLNLRFTSGLTDTKTITVNSLNTLNGNLTIGYTYSASDTTEDVYKYDITVNTINGNLMVYGGNYSLMGTVNINTALVGSIYLSTASHSGPNVSSNSSTAALTVKFGESAKMTGDIADRSDGYAGIRKDVYFAGSGTVLTGNIVSLGTSTFSQYLNFYTGNRIYFTQGNMTGNIIAGGVAKTTNANDTGNVDKKGLNVVVFGDTTSSTTQTLTGGILASDASASTSNGDTNTEQATNVVVLADNTTLNIKSDGNDTTTVNKFAGDNVVGGDDGSSTSSVGFSVTSGSIVARNFGVNEIRIYKGSTLNLNDGSGSIKSYISGANSTTITNGSALNKINFLSEGGKINGSIVADNSKNTGTSNKASVLIYVDNNASGTITGNLTTVASTSGSVSGRMLVTLGSSNTTSVTGVTTSNATTTAITDNTSTLTLQGSSNTITGLTATGVTSSGTTTTGSDAANTANLVLDSSKSTTTDGQTTTISGTVSNNASALNFI